MFRGGGETANRTVVHLAVVMPSSFFRGENLCSFIHLVLCLTPSPYLSSFVCLFVCLPITLCDAQLRFNRSGKELRFIVHLSGKE